MAIEIEPAKSSQFLQCFYAFIPLSHFIDEHEDKDDGRECLSSTVEIERNETLHPNQFVDTSVW